MAQLLHPRSKGEIHGCTYAKSADSNLEEALELERCIRLSLWTPHVRPIKFLEYDSRKNLLTTEFIHGETLFNLLWNRTSPYNPFFFGSTVSPKILLLRIEELGNWLACYHSSWNPCVGRNVPTQWLDWAFDGRLKVLSEKKMLDEKLLKKIGEYLKFLPQKMEDSNHSRVCKIHGDFIAYNMVYDRYDDVHILDFADTRIGFNFEDVVRFWEHMWAMSQTSKHRSRFFSKACEAFLSGYGLNQSVVTQENFEALRLYNAITNLMSIQGFGKFLGWWSRRIVRKITYSSVFWVKETLLSSG